MTIAVLGGTGAEGLGISARLAVAGEEVIIGSRDPRRAAQAAATLAAELPGARVRSAVNCDAATAAGIVVLAVPFGGVEELLGSCASALDGKVVLEVVNPLRVARGVFGVVQVPEGSVGAHVRARAPAARVVSGLKHVSAASLRDVSRRLTGDVLLCGDDEGAKSIVADLVRRMPDLRSIDAGGLAVAPLLDHVTALLLTLNRRHRAETSLRIIGL